MGNNRAADCRSRRIRTARRISTACLTANCACRCWPRDSRLSATTMTSTSRGWRFESGSVEAFARDEGGRAPGDLRNWRAQERGGDGVGGRGGCERRKESAGEDQSGQGAGASGIAGGGEGEQVVRGVSFGAAG